MEYVTIGGIDLSGDFVACDVKRPLPYVQSEFEHVPGSDGYVLKSADIVPSPIEFALVMTAKGERERRMALRRVAPLLTMREAVDVAFSSDDGLYYKAVPNGSMELSEFVKSGRMDVVMQPLDAAMYGKQMTFSIYSSTATSFFVSCSHPVSPIITATTVRGDNSSGLFGIRLDDGDFMHVEVSKNADHDIVFDCANRTVTVDGYTSMITLDSDWLEFAPGEHSITRDVGSFGAGGRISASYDERWL